ncbi:DeoR/GlpR family DNA-binding transcription regulator [Streptococcus sp. S784/96/1]|uniref:DeoR/GlpR family DNA-binding transcription regulator n=1 Tax=Streptococcus sp. S784/96/1 TaxID=2653499 RepID=UPI0013870AD0|nr:DeoR/GlpR family DNA-binding transcription regulator [Streptococcus sp. S784/96/1]
MIKKERHERILDMLKVDGIITVKEMIKELNISDMTARRDLDALAEEGLLTRTHGGAQRIYNPEEPHEKTHIEKKVLQTKEKKRIAQKANSLITDGETIFIGPGTTLEHLAIELKSRNIRVITNSLPVFLILNHSQTIDLLLIGGEYREVTGAFIGSMATANLKTLRFSKAFVSANAISDNAIATYSDVEGEIQQLALDNAVEKILLVDSTKFNRYDFFNFYTLDQLDAIITDNQITQEQLDEFGQSTTIIQAD